MKSPFKICVAVVLAALFSINVALGGGFGALGGAVGTGSGKSAAAPVGPPAFRSIGSYGSGTSSMTPGMPTGWQPNDILLLFVETANNISSPPTGWANVTGSPTGNGPADGATSVGLAVFWRRAQSGDTAPSIAPYGNHVSGIIAAFSGCVTSGNPWDVTSFDGGASSDTAVSCPTVTTTGSDRLVVVCEAHALPDSASGNQISGWSNGNLTSLTERFDYNTDQGNGGGLSMATGNKAAAGATGATTATLLTACLHSQATIALK